MIKPPMRTPDKHGEGHFGARRGKRTHIGIDLACAKDSTVCALASGRITKVGYPYIPSDPEKGHLRYIQIETAEGDRHRYFYVSLFGDLSLNDFVRKWDEIGKAQGLLDIYPGIGDHIHFEIKTAGGEPVDPLTVIDWL